MELDLIRDLEALGDPQKAGGLAMFFKAFPGGYGGNDRFWGIPVPAQKSVARKYYQILATDRLESLLGHPVHEVRLTAVFILVLKAGKAKNDEQMKPLVEIYLRNLAGINNWDLVDSSAHKLLGVYLIDKDRKLLDDLAGSGHLWKQRIALITTLHFIRNGCYEDTFRLVRTLMDHPHDLIHKAAGWMLREIGNRDFTAEYVFLREHYRVMPRTMLRYAIEKFDPDLRKSILTGALEP